MSCEKAKGSVYGALTDRNAYPICRLNRFKADPRVKVGPRANVGDDWVIFDFATMLQRSRRRWFVFKARSRFYAVDARSAHEARRIVEQYKAITVVVTVAQHEVAESAAGPGSPGLDRVDDRSASDPRQSGNPPRLAARAPQSRDGITPLRLARGRFLGLLANRRAKLERHPG